MNRFGAYSRPLPKANRRRWHPALGLLALAVILGCAAESPQPVSIIIVDIDTLRADHLGCYGYERPTSPHIDAFCRESVQFTWAFSQAPNTPPSQASILTSLYPTSHGRIEDQQILAPETLTLAEAFQGAGYRTGAFVDGGLMAAEFGLDQGFEIYDDEAGGVAAIGPKARSWLQQTKAEPFLLLLHSYDVHSPYENTPEPFRSRFLEGVEVPAKDFVKRMTWRMEQRRVSRYGDNPHSLSRVEVEYAKALYDGGIAHLDDWFGNLVQFLKDEGIYDRSIIAFISDHGDEFEEHDSVFHERLYSPVTRIPLMIRFPGGEDARAMASVVETVDLMPTLLAAAGLAVPDGLQGQDLTALIRNEASSYRQLAVSESPFFGRRIAVATSDLRLVYTASDDSRELYRYRQDPHEQNDIAAEEPKVAQQLVEAVKSWAALVESDRPEAPDVTSMKESTLEQLRALGYLND